MKNLSGLTGWVVLAAVLAVPAALFYNWFTRVNAVKSEQHGASASVSGPVFKSSEESAPLSGNAGHAAQEIPVKTPAAVSSAPRAKAETAVSVSARPAAGAAVKASSAAAVIAYAPRVDRDPTLSPEEAAELERLLAPRLEKPKQKRPEDMLSLQGIIEGRGGNRAIINGNVYGVGAVVSGIRVTRIKTDSIVCEYKGRKFVKKIPD